MALRSLLSASLKVLRGDYKAILVRPEIIIGRWGKPKIFGPIKLAIPLVVFAKKRGPVG
jgi:hypothetical protein